MTNKLKIPNLRFPEFNGEWEEKKLGEVATFFNSKRVPLTEWKRDKGLYPYYWASWIIDYVKDYIFDGEYILLWEDWANILTRSTKLVFLAKWKFWVNNHAHVFQAKWDNYFLTEALERINYEKYNTWTAQPKLNNEALQNINLHLPSLPEQEKIAEFLSKVDERIEASKKEKEALEQYKKWISQKIFSQEIRFKNDNGEEFGDWEEKKLGEVCKITTWKIDANAMVENWQYRFYTCAKDFFRIDNYAFDTEALLISWNWANVWYIHYYNWKFNAYQRTYVLDWFKENIIYIKHFLHKNLKKRIMSEVNEWNTPYIVLSTLTDFKIHLPTLPEQEKIAEFLSKLDDKISEANLEIEKLENFKKGLLQNMFV